ncbi:MAG: hypothetical protein IKK01_02255 [Clostridia bacterium]|nr:hypothetical protein [Clostridia bacterium]
MKKRIIAIIALFALALVALSACAEQNYDFVDKTYIYEKLINESTFVIKINSDRTVTYIDNSNDSTIEGSWKYKDGILTVTHKDDNKAKSVNLFVIADGNLSYIAEGSDGFSSVTFDDGDEFICIS